MKRIFALILFILLAVSAVNAGELLTYPRFMAIDGNGKPMRGALLYTYEAGTSTAKFAYQDKACTVAHTNPVVMDSDGTKIIYLKGSYKLNLKTASGGQVPGWPIDNIEGTSQAILGYYYPSSAAADQGVTGDSNTIKYYVDAIGANTGTIYLSHTKGAASTTYTLGTSETIPANVNLIIEPGAIISVSAGQTLTINGKLDAPISQIFAGTGTVTLGGNIASVYSEWWYSGSGSYDTAIQSALDSTGGPVNVTFLPNKTYALVSGVTVRQHRVWMLGAGKGSTTFTFTPTGTASAVTFDLAGASALVQCGIRGVTFTGSGAQIKTAIEMVNTEELTIEDVAVGTWTDATYASVGIRSRGKHMVKIRNNTISADIPIQISQNTDRATEGNIDCDHFWIENNYLTAASTNANILIDSGVNLYNMKIDGGAWVLGGFGLKWVDTATALAGINMSIKNIRWEQSTYADGYLIQLDHNYQFQNLIVDNVYGGASTKGIKISKVAYASIKNYEYTGSTSAFEADANSRPVIFSNCFIVGGTVTMTGLKKVFYLGQSSTAGIIGGLEIYDTPTANAMSNVRTGLVTPVSAVTPNAIGEIYVDTVTGTPYFSTGLTNADWSSGGGSSSGGVATDSNCNQAAYYSIGTLCADTDDGKLYKGTGVAVEEIASGSSGDMTKAEYDATDNGYVDVAEALKSSATTGVMTVTGPGVGTTRVKTVRDANDTVLEQGGSYTPTGTWNWTSVTWSNTPTLNQNTTGTAANLSGTPALPNGTTATTQSAGDSSTKLSTTAYVDAVISNTSYGAAWNGVSGIAPSKDAVHDMIVALIGSASGDTNLGTFTGSTISDSVSVKTALQELETAFEGLPGGHDAVTLAASLTGIATLSTQEISLDDQTANYVLAGPTSGAADTPAFRALVADDIPDITTKFHIDDIVTLTGVAAESTHLGTFTGSTIADNQTIKAAIQTLETAFEALPGGHDAVTLAASATPILGLSTQEISFDTQTANYVLAGPTTGAAAAPTFRALVAADIPSLSSTYQPLDATLTAFAALTIADVSIVEGTGADGFNVVTSGGGTRFLGSNSGNTALSFQALTMDMVADTASYQRVAAADVDANSHVNLVQDSDGTGAVQFTGLSTTRAITLDDAAQELAARNRANTFTENNVFGNANSDTLTIQSTIKGSGRAVTIDDDGTTSPAYATATQSLFVTGIVESGAAMYATSFISTGGTDGQYRSTYGSNTSFDCATYPNSIYYLSNAMMYCNNTSSRTPANLEAAQTFTALKTLGAGIAISNDTSAGFIDIYEGSGSGTNKVRIQAQAMASDYTLTLPVDDGTANQVLQTDGSGGLSWGTVSATAAGSAGSIQYTSTGSGGALEGSAHFLFVVGASYADLYLGSEGTGRTGRINLSYEGGASDYTAVIQPNSSMAGDITVTLPAATGTLISSAGSETWTGVQTYSAASNNSTVSVLTFSGTPALNGSDVHRDIYLNHSLGTITGTTNTVALIDIAALTGDAETNLYGLRIGNLTGTTGSNSEVEHGINIGTGWDRGISSASPVYVGDGTNGTTIGATGNVSLAGTATFTVASATSSVPWVVGTGTAANTAEGTAYWESDTNILTIGDGATGISLAFTANTVYTFPSATATLAKVDSQVFTTYIEAPYIILGSAATAADAGTIRMPNAGTIMFEADAAGTDINALSVDSSEIVQIGASGASGVTITPDTTITGDLTVSGADITLAAAGVKLTGSNGSLTILGLGDGQDEDIKFDFNTTANTITVSSPASGATAISFSALNLVTTGTIQGGIVVSSDADGMDAAAMTAAGMYGTLFIATGAGTWILPRAVLGMSACLMDSGTAHDLILDVTAGSTIRLKGTEGSDGVGITNASGSTTGDFVCVVAVATDKWSTMGMQGTWASQ